MTYLRNTDLAELYKVSEDTITNWVKAAKLNKINLQVVEEGKRTYIVNNPHNHLVLKDLSRKAKKYKNRKSLKIIEPRKEFYQVYSEKQVIDIISNIEINREIPHKYAYFDTGAYWFDEYTRREGSEDGASTLKKTIEVLGYDTEYIYSLISDYEKINIIDIGPGNGMPLKKFVDLLIQKQRLRKYISIDISPQILSIVQQNFYEWFGDKVIFEAFQKDITSDSIQDILYVNTHDGAITTPENTINLVFFLGSTIENQYKYEESLITIRKSMGKNDVLILGQVLDTESTKIHLFFSAFDKFKNNSDLGLILTVTNLLNINDTMFDVHRYYDASQKARIIAISLKYDIDILFETKSFNQIVSLSSKEPIIIFRHNHHSIMEITQIFHELGLRILSTTTSTTGDQIQIISKIKSL